MEKLKATETTTELEFIESNIIYYKKQTVESILAIGENLIKAKVLVKHGEWSNWLSTKVDFSERIAQKFMKCAKEFPKATLSTDLSQTKIFALLDIKKEKRDEFIDGIDKTKLADMTTKEFKGKIKEFKTPKVEPKVEVPKEKVESKPKVETPKFVNKKETPKAGVADPEYLADLKQQLNDLFDYRHEVLSESNVEFNRIHDDLDAYCKDQGLYDNLHYTMNLAELLAREQEHLQTYLSPFIYSQALKHLGNPTVKENLLEMIGNIDGWSKEMKKLINGEVRKDCKVNKDEVIDVEIIK